MAELQTEFALGFLMQFLPKSICLLQELRILDFKEMMYTGVLYSQ